MPVPVLEQLEGHSARLIKGFATTYSGMKGALIIAPDGVDGELNGILFVPPSATFGDSQDYGEAQAFSVMRETGGTALTKLRARMNFDGWFGCTAAHFSPGANGDDSAASQALWIDPEIDTLGLLISQAPVGTSPVAKLLVIAENLGDQRIIVDKDFNLDGYQTDGATLVYRLESAAAAAVARALFKTVDAATIGLLVQGLATATQTADLVQVKSSSTLQWRIDKSGFMGLRKVSAPADGDIASSEYMPYLVDTNGSPRVMAKGKQADGTVFHKSVTRTFVRKTSDESINTSTTLQNDDELVFAIGAGETWTFRFVCWGTANTAGDFKFGVDVPASPTFLRYGLDGPVGTATASNTGQLSTSTTTDAGALSCGGSAADSKMTIEGVIVNGANAGNVQLQWAQDASNAANSTLRSGSFLIAERVA